MIKKILIGNSLLILMMVFCTPQLNAQARTYTEDFSQPTGLTLPTGWTSTNSTSNTGNNGYWKIGPFSGSPNYDVQNITEHTGNGGNYFWVDGSTPYPIIVYGETKTFDFVNHWNLVLEFWLTSYNTTYASSGHNTFTIDFYDGLMWHNTVFSQKGNNPSVAWDKKTVNLSAFKPQGTEQVKFRFTVNKDAGTPFYNDIIIDDFSVSGDLAMLGMNNAAADGFKDPTVCLGANDIDVVIANRGTNQIDSLELHWEVDGVPQTMVKYNQLLDSLTGTGRSSDNVTLGQVNFAFGVPRTIKYWTSMPNGVQDTINDNDTLEVVRFSSLSGLYTVGSGSRDFPNLDSAVTFLNAVGVCGATIFELQDTIHAGHVEIGDVLGSSSTNTITFTSAGKDASLCVVNHTSSNSSNNYVFTLNGSRFINFDNLTIANAATGNNAGVISIVEGNDINFEKCNLFSAHSGSSVNSYLVTARDEIVENLDFSNCQFEGGSWGIYLNGGTNTHVNISISDNIFKNTYASAIWINEAEGLVVERNNFSSSSTNAGTIAINLANLSDYVEIYGNHLTHSATWPMMGLRINGSAGKSNQHNLIMNNAFSVGDTSSSTSGNKAGIDLINVAFYDVVFNTMAISTSNSSAYAFGISNSNGNDIYNNVFANMGSGGDAVNVSGLGSVLSMDNNLIYSMADFGSFSGTGASDLSDWQNLSGFDANSASEDPLFSEIDTLKICSKLGDNIGNKSGLVTDIEGNLRDPLNPDPGAYEYSSISGITVEDAFICNGDEADFFVAAAANDLIIWNYTDTSSKFSTKMEGTYTLTAIGECGADTTSFDVLINELVKLSNDTSICGGDTIFATSNIMNGSYSWNTGSTSMMEKLYKTGQYYVNVVDSDGCFSADTIEIIASQVVSLREDTMICEGQTVLLTPGTPAGSYTWFRDGVSISTASQIYADSTGKFVVLYSDQNSCNSTDTFDLVVNKLPRSGFTYTQNQNNLEFTANDPTGANYFWSFGDGKKVNGPAWKTLNIYAANGSYNVSLVISSAHCGDSTSSQTIDLETIGINDYSSNNGVNVYPNPTSNFINISYNPELNKVNKLVILDLTGKIVYSEDVQEFEGDIRLNLEEIVNSKGVYLIKTFDADNQTISTTRISLI
ncbi:MAG: T9SS type A sorting domain-containing protein [Salibacteraceae bacterium]